MYILYCDIFWLKLIDRIFFNQIFNTTVVSQGIPSFFQFQLFCRQQLYIIMIKHDLELWRLFNIERMQILLYNTESITGL
jgi:hypothetical protein